MAVRLAIVVSLAFLIWELVAKLSYVSAVLLEAACPRPSPPSTSLRGCPLSTRNREKERLPAAPRPAHAEFRGSERALLLLLPTSCRSTDWPSPLPA